MEVENHSCGAVFLLEWSRKKIWKWMRDLVERIAEQSKRILTQRKFRWWIVPLWRGFVFERINDYDNVLSQPLNA